MLLVLPVLFGLVHSSFSDISCSSCFTHSLITHSLIYLPTHLYTHPPTCPPTHPFPHSPTNPPTHPPTHPTHPTHLPTHPLRSPSPLPIQLSIHSATHPPTHPTPHITHAPILPLVCPATHTLSSSQKIAISRTHHAPCLLSPVLWHYFCASEHHP